MVVKCNNSKQTVMTLRERCVCVRGAIVRDLPTVAAWRTAVAQVGGGLLKTGAGDPSHFSSKTDPEWKFPSAM